MLIRYDSLGNELTATRAPHRPRVLPASPPPDLPPLLPSMPALGLALTPWQMPPSLTPLQPPHSVRSHKPPVTLRKKSPGRPLPPAAGSGGTRSVTLVVLIADTVGYICQNKNQLRHALTILKMPADLLSFSSARHPRPQLLINGKKYR